MNATFQVGQDARRDAGNYKNQSLNRWKVFKPEEIKELRAKLGLTQVQFAHRLDLTYELVRSWEQGKRTPDQRTCLILSLVNYAPDEVFRLIAEAEVHQKMSFDRDARGDRIKKHTC